MRVKIPVVFLCLTALTAAVIAEDVKVIVYNFDGRAKAVRNKKTIPVELDMACQSDDFYRSESDSFIDFTVKNLGGVRLFELGELVTENTNPSHLIFNLKTALRS